MRGVRLNILLFQKFIYIGFLGGQVYQGKYPNGKWKMLVIEERRIP
jgi:hypothetical protein